jgi:acyl-CoA thioester hydrolase
LYIESQFMPRFCDSDAAGHINNTAVAQWLEVGRFDIYHNYMADLSPLMLRRIEIDYLLEMNYREEVTIRTGVESVGEKTVTLRQEVWQGGIKRADCLAIDCYFDRNTRRSAAIPNELRPLCDDFMFEPGRSGL